MSNSSGPLDIRRPTAVNSAARSRSDFADVRREIGIRIAVGAQPAGVARMFLASGVRVGAVALLLGLPLSIVALRLALSQGIVIAPGVNVWAIGLGIAVILLAVASAATWCQRVVRREWTRRQRCGPSKGVLVVAA